MHLYLFGFGKMGKRVAQIAETRGHQIVTDLAGSDVSIDFSSASGVSAHVEEACAAHVPIIIGTTGWEAELASVQACVEKGQNGALYAPNFSIGIAYFRRLLKEAHRLLADHAIAGVEMHHDQKRDAPSGTAKAIADDLGMETPFSSVRCGSIVGKHEVIFDTPWEVISLKHEAKNRDSFALGAVKAAEWIQGKKGWFTLDDLLHSSDHTL